MHERAFLGLAYAGLALALSEPTPEELEERRTRKAMYAIQELARAFGDHARFFGYARHEATKSKSKSASLQRMLGRKFRQAA